MDKHFIDMIYTMGEGIGFIALFFTNVLFIRSTMFISSCIFVISGYFIGLSAMTWWALLYISINGFKMVMLLKDKRKKNLSSPQLRLHKALPQFDKSEILSLLSIGHYENIPALALKNKTEQSIRFLFLGEVISLSEGHSNSSHAYSEKVVHNHFIGQRYIFSKSNSVTSWLNPYLISCLTWSISALDKLKKKQPELYTKFLEALSLEIYSRIVADVPHLSHSTS